MLLDLRVDALRNERESVAYVTCYVHMPISFLVNDRQPTFFLR